jgi:hypothetical protein
MALYSSACILNTFYGDVHFNNILKFVFNLLKIHIFFSEISKVKFKATTTSCWKNTAGEI